MNIFVQCLPGSRLFLFSLISKKVQRTGLLAGLLLSMLLPPVQADTVEEPDLQGAWVGTLQVGSSQLRLRFNVSRDKDQQYLATMDSIDQGASGIPVSRVSVKQQQVGEGSSDISGERDHSAARCALPNASPLVIVIAE